MDNLEGFNKFVDVAIAENKKQEVPIQVVWLRQQEAQDRKLGITPKQFWVKTGFEELDKSTNGFVSGSMYVFGGLKKSGKSTFLMNVLNNMLLNGEKVGFLDTELKRTNFIRRFTAISQGTHEFDSSNDETLQDSWKEIFINSNQLHYAEDNEVSTDGIIDANKTILLFERWRAEGTRVFVVDNITTLMSQTTGQKQGYQMLSDYITKLSKYAKDSNIVLIVVLHTVDKQLIYKENATKIYKLLENKEPEKLLDESITINTRPSSSDLYGGGVIRSQISGGVLLLWRPYQQFKDINYKKLSMLILEDWRYEMPNMSTEYKLDYQVEKSSYSELPVFEERNINERAIRRTENGAF